MSQEIWDFQLQHTRVRHNLPVEIYWSAVGESGNLDHYVCSNKDRPICLRNNINVLDHAEDSLAKD